MNKGAILLTIVVLLCASSMAGAWEFGMKGEFQYNLNFTYSSRHIWRGYDFFPSNTGAFSTSANVDFWGTGFGADILWTRPIQSGYEYWEWLVFDPYYEEDECWDDYWYETDYRIGWRYYYFPDGPLNHCCHHRDLDFQEFYGRFAWPRLFPYGFVPYYEAARIWPSTGGRYYDGCPKSYWRTYGGWFHTFGIRKEVPLPEDFFSALKPRLSFSYDITYNDGAGPTVDTSKRNADHDWSHSVFNVSTDFYICRNVTFTAGFNHQVSMDQSVNNDNETWFTLNTRINF